MDFPVCRRAHGGRWITNRSCHHFHLAIRIPFVVLHVDAVVHRLRKTVRDRLRDSKQPIQQF